MNNINTPKPIEPPVGARFEIDSHLSDNCLCDANGQTISRAYIPLSAEDCRRLQLLEFSVSVIDIREQYPMQRKRPSQATVTKANRSEG